MKKLIPLFALFIVCFSSCKKEEEKKAPVNLLNMPLNERPIPTLPNSNNLATGVVGGAHYICPKKCEGGTSSAQGACPVCKTTLAHNQAFHNTATPTTTSTPAASPLAKPASGPNAKGIYHYTCKNGCAGGGDAAGKCASCSSDLAHNAAYHN